MKPSSFKTSSTRVRKRELGDLIVAIPRSWPLRMRARRSPMGSVIAISSNPSLPTCLGHARDLAELRQIAQRNAGQFQFAVVALGAARHLAAIMDAHLRGVARQLGELEARLKTLLRRHLHVVGLRLERGTLRRVLRDHLFALLVAVDLAG